MKKVATCKKCNKEFECIKENEIPVDYSKVKLEGVITFPTHKYTCPCGSTEHSEPDFIPLTLEEANEVATCLQNGSSHKYHIGSVDRKIGESHICDKCGHVSFVVDYCGLTNSDNTFISCSCELTFEKEDWYECSDKNCDFHKNFDVEKMRKDDNEFKVKQGIVNEIFEKYPPKNDGILELERIMFMFGNMYGKENTGGNYITVYHEFVNYCAEHDILQR